MTNPRAFHTAISLGVELNDPMFIFYDEEGCYILSGDDKKQLDFKQLSTFINSISPYKFSEGLDSNSKEVSLYENNQKVLSLFISIPEDSITIIYEGKEIEENFGEYHSKYLRSCMRSALNNIQYKKER